LFPRIGSNRPQHYQITFDGLLVTSNAEAPPKAQRAYTHIFRTGAVEAVASSILRSDGAMIVPQSQALIVKYAGVYMRALRKLGVEPPKRTRGWFGEQVALPYCIPRTFCGPIVRCRDPSQDIVGIGVITN
jgi:hypothetical protein